MRRRSITEHRLNEPTPESLTRRLVTVEDVSGAISDICEHELKHTMTYACLGEGLVELNIPAMGHGLSLFLKGIGGRSVLELEGIIDGEYFAIVCRSGEGLPSRRELAGVSIAMRKAGFEFYLQGDVVILRTALKNPEVLTVYAGGANGIKQEFLLELFDFVNKYLHKDE